MELKKDPPPPLSLPFTYFSLPGTTKHQMHQALKDSAQIILPGLGTLQGAIDEQCPQVTRFMNIPFGAVTKRWRPAEKPAPWSGVRDATKQG